MFTSCLTSPLLTSLFLNLISALHHHLTLAPLSSFDLSSPLPSSGLISSPFHNSANNTSSFNFCLNLYLSVPVSGTVQDSKGWVAFLQQWVAPERFGFEKLDSINYYTSKLVELNKKVGQYYNNTFILTLSSSVFLSYLIPSFFHSSIHLTYLLTRLLTYVPTFTLFFIPFSFLSSNI